MLPMKLHCPTDVHVIESKKVHEEGKFDPGINKIRRDSTEIEFYKNYSTAWKMLKSRKYVFLNLHKFTAGMDSCNQ